MKVTVSGIPEEGLQFESDLPVIIYNKTKPDTAHVFIKVFRFEKRVLVEGSVKMDAAIKCSRCLNESLSPLDIAFREEYVPAEDTGKEEEKELSQKDLDLSYYRDDEINIDEIIKEQVLLSVPMKPLCREECRGLCPVCGKDLNEGACECKRDKIDPRLAPLARLKGILNNRKE